MKQRDPGRPPIEAHLIQAIRAGLFSPLRIMEYLPVGPMRYIWLIRLVTWADKPMRTYLIALNSR